MAMKMQYRVTTIDGPAEYLKRSTSTLSKAAVRKKLLEPKDAKRQGLYK